MMNEEQLKSVYNNTSNQDRQLFHKQLLHFIKIIGSTAYTQERKEKEFQNLTQAYFRCNLEEGDITLFVATCEEFERRNEYAFFNRDVLKGEGE